MQTVEKAVMHYLDKISRESDYYAIRAVMADAVGVKTSTLQIWFKNSAKPEGMSWLKVAYFLEEQGYELQELKSLNPDIHLLGRCVAKGQLEITAVVDSLDMTQKSQVFRLLRDGITPMPERLQRIKKLINPYVSSASANVTSLRQKTHVSQDEALFKKLDSALVILDTASGLIHSDLESLLSDDFTPEQRAAFRDHVDPDKFFRLTNRVSRTVKLLMNLGSETAREHGSQKR